MIDHTAKLIISENCAIRRDPSIVGDGYTVKDTNLAQEFAHTPMFAGRTGLIIDGCNIFNCDFPEGTVIKDNCAWKGVHQDPSPEVEPVPEPSRTDLLAEQVAIEASTNTLEMLNSLLKAAPIDATIGLYNADGVERIVKAGE